MEQIGAKGDRDAKGIRGWMDLPGPKPLVSDQSKTREFAKQGRG